MSFRVLMPSFIRQLENDAKAQAKFHLSMAWFWAFTMIATPIAFYPRTVEDFLQLLILEVSLYANWATEFGSLSSAQASIKADKGDYYDQTRF